MKDILIIRGDNTSFDDGNLFIIRINNDTESLEGFSASLQIDTVTLTYEDVSSGEITVNLTSSQTRNLQIGKVLGKFILYDNNNRPKLTCNIPFTVADNLPTWRANNPDINVNLVDISLIHNSRLYTDLKELPTLNDIVIIGDKTAADYGLATLDNITTDIYTHDTSITSHQDIRDLIENLTHRVSELEQEVSDLKQITNI